MRNRLHEFDKTIHDALLRLPKWCDMPMLLITQLGSTAVIVGLNMFIIGVGYTSNNEPLAIAGIVSLGTGILGNGLKLLWRRSRPVSDYVERMFFKTYSFPSGHSSSSTLLYGMLAYLVAGIAIQPWSIAAVGILAALPILVGLSRVYLGAHYASDVLAGWLLGGAGLAVIVFIVKPTL